MKNKKNIRSSFLRAAVLVPFILPVCSSLRAESLSLEIYLKQVKEKNKAVLAGRTAIQAAQESMALKSLLISPYLFADLQHAKDKSRKLDSASYGTSRMQDEYQVGLEQQTPYGQSARLYYQNTFTSVDGANPLYLPYSEYNESRFTLEIKQDLWRNFFGRATRAGRKAIEEKSKAQVQEQAYQVKQILVQAEMLYWRLSLARKMVQLEKDLLARSQELYNWVKRRVDLKLQDRSDLMQSESDVLARTLELSSTEDQEKLLTRNFNLMRDADSDIVTEELILPQEEYFKVPELNEKSPLRKDIRSLMHYQSAFREQALLNKENTLPELNVYVSGALNGLNQEFSEAFSDSTGTKYYTLAAGLSLRMPLDFIHSHRARKGYDHEADANETFLSQKKLSVQTEWSELIRKLKKTYKRFQLVKELETLQKKKADYERMRLQKGNTITLQVLQFEQDYAQSQLARLEVEMNLLELLAQIKLYEE
ncbi:MAG: TolC family protein [bacterium]|nr:TolC family protein [bacterium]